MCKKIKNLVFPLINILLSIFLITIISTNSEKMFFTILLGFIMGGIIPFVFILIFQIDTTDCFLSKLIFVIISIIVCAFSWLSILDYRQIYIPLVIETVSIFYYLLIDYSDDFDQGIFIKIIKALVLSLSNPLMIYIGILLDLINSIDMTKFTIPG